VRQYQPKAQRSTSNLSRFRLAARPKIIRRPTPWIVVHPCSNRRPAMPDNERHRINTSAMMPVEFLRVDCVLNGHGPGHTVRCGGFSGGQRSAFLTSGQSQHHPQIRRTQSDNAGVTLASGLNYKFQHEALVHATAAGPLSNANDHPAPAAMNPVQNDSPNCSFSDIL